jgi:hypothetical protein
MRCKSKKYVLMKPDLSLLIFVLKSICLIGANAPKKRLDHPETFAYPHQNFAYKNGA